MKQGIVNSVTAPSLILLLTSASGSREDALAECLVGQTARCLDVDLKIRASLFGDGAPSPELLAEIHKVVGSGSEDPQASKTAEAA